MTVEPRARTGVLAPFPDTDPDPDPDRARLCPQDRSAHFARLGGHDVGEINDLAVAFLAARGFQTVSRAGVGAALGNYGQGEPTPDEVFALGHRADSAATQALVLSCTDMRAVETPERLEQAPGEPVVSSNQVMVFAALPHLGLPPGSVRRSRLFGQMAAA